MIELVFIILVLLPLAFGAARYSTNTFKFDGFVFTCAFLAIALGVSAAVAMPYIKVWQRGLVGQAAMAEAEANRQIQVREAQAKKDSAVLLAEAEVERAKGLREANQIVQESLGGPENYLRYLFIENLEKVRANGGQVIYIPIDGGLPVLESTRLMKPPR